MEVVKRGFSTVTRAIHCADEAALKTGRVHSVRHTKNGKSFYVVTGMTGDALCAYVARPETLLAPLATGPKLPAMGVGLSQENQEMEDRTMKLTSAEKLHLLTALESEYRLVSDSPGYEDYAKELMALMAKFRKATGETIATRGEEFR